VLVLTGAAPARTNAPPLQRATLTLVDRDGTPLSEPFVFTVSPDPFGFSYPAVGVKIDPPPQVVPSVSFASADTHVFDVGPPPNGPAAVTSPLSQVLRFVSPGHADLIVRVGAPYNAELRLPVDTYGTLPLRCILRRAPVFSVGPLERAADGRLVPEPDVSYTTRDESQRLFCGSYVVKDQAAAELVHTPYGAVRFPADTPVESLHASQWRDEIREAPPTPAVWLARAANGATIKFLTPSGSYEIAPPGGDFPVRHGPPGVLSVTRTIRAPAPIRFRVTIAADGSFTAADTPHLPVLIGYSRSRGYLDSLFGATLRAEFTPEPAEPRAGWSTTGPLNASVYGPASNAALSASGLGTGSVTAALDGRNDVSASRRVLVYRSLSLGCTDVVDGFGVRFGDDGAARIVNSPGDADFYASSSADVFRCERSPRAPPTPFTPGVAQAAPSPPSGGWYFPNGGIVLHPGGGFPSVKRSMWQAAVKMLPSEELQKLIGRSANGETVLLLKARSGRLVKLLPVPREMPSFVGLYAVSRADGTFAY
jgi:hypothetical protein